MVPIFLRGLNNNSFFSKVLRIIKLSSLYDVYDHIFYTTLYFSGLFFHVVGEGVVNLSKKAENFTDKENYIDFRLRLLGEPGKSAVC